MRSILFNLTQIFFCSIASFILMNFNLLFIHDFRWGQQNKHTYIYIYALIHRIQYDPFDIQFPSVAYAVYGRDGNISWWDADRLTILFILKWCSEINAYLHKCPFASLHSGRNWTTMILWVLEISASLLHCVRPQPIYILRFSDRKWISNCLWQRFHGGSRV